MVVIPVVAATVGPAAELIIDTIEDVFRPTTELNDAELKDAELNGAELNDAELDKLDIIDPPVELNVELIVELSVELVGATAAFIPTMKLPVVS